MKISLETRPGVDDDRLVGVFLLQRGAASSPTVGGTFSVLYPISF